MFLSDEIICRDIKNLLLIKKLRQTFFSMIYDFLLPPTYIKTHIKWLLIHACINKHTYMHIVWECIACSTNVVFQWNTLSLKYIFAQWFPGNKLCIKRQIHISHKLVVMRLYLVTFMFLKHIFILLRQYS